MSLGSFALILGIVCYLFGFPLVFDDRKHIAWRKTVMNDEQMIRVVGTVFACLSVITLREHAILSKDIAGFVVFSAWVALAKSLVAAFSPSSTVAFYALVLRRFGNDDGGVLLTGFLTVLLGALYTYIGLALP